MNPWMLLILIVIVLTVIGVLYLSARTGKFTLIRKWTGDVKWKRFLLGMLFVGLAVLALYLWIGFINMMICVLHVFVIWLFADLIGLIVRKCRKKASRFYYAGAAAVFFSAVYLGYGWYNSHHVVPTAYAVETDKDLKGEPLRIVMFADSHVGATFHAAEFAEYVKEMEALKPDVLVIVGDYVDDDTTKEDMISCCEALGSIQVRDGIYFAYGNHDRGYFGSRSYTAAELESELIKNGVTVLRDEAMLVQDRFYLIGREDARYLGRASMDQLLAGLDREKYMVVLDHEPHDYAAQEKSGADLVLSGHTHGGWLFPFTVILRYVGPDNRIYGREKRSDTEFIVTSGISEWALKFKTGCPAEYVVVDIAGK